MKSNNTPQLREKSVDELHTRERELTEQLFKLRFQRATGRMESPAKMRQVRAAASQQVVNNNYAPAFAEQGVTKMRSQETGATGDESALLAHAFFVPFFKMLPAGTPSGWEAARPTL